MGHESERRMSDEVWQVVTTTDSEERAAEIASTVVERHLGACVQVEGPIQSTYRWEGRATTDSEWRVTIKTTASRYNELATWLLKHHSYDVPELLATVVKAGNPEYIKWVVDETAKER